MLKQLLSKFKESSLSVLPVFLIVIVMSLTPFFNLEVNEIIVFLVSSLLLILGISLFDYGATMSMSSMGDKIGSSLVKTKNINIIVLICFVMGTLITIAEPDLSVLAEQVSSLINPLILEIMVGIGVGIFLVISILKIIYKKDLNTIIIFFYFALFAVTCLVILKGNGNFIALAFDSGGVTTGPVTVPFIMSLGVGVAYTIGGRNVNENSFGILALCSIGPVIIVMIMGIFIDSSSLSIIIEQASYKIQSGAIDILFNIGKTFLGIMGEVAIALGLIIVCFLIINFIFIKLSRKKLKQIFIGISYTFFGLVIFLTSASIGFVPIGYKLGISLANHKVLLTVFGFLMGIVVVLAEPAIHILTKQVEEVTTGGVSKKSMLIALCIGVGLAISLSIIRIIFNFSILYILIPGYIISLGLSFFVPKIYTAIAFDSGGVASGSMASSFVLPFAIGICSVLQPSAILEDAFGVVALIAVAPLIAIQILGFKAIIVKNMKTKAQIKKIIDANDEEIIYFM